MHFHCRRTSDRCWCRSTHIVRSTSTPRTIRRNTKASTSMKCRLTCELICLRQPRYFMSSWPAYHCFHSLPVVSRDSYFTWFHPLIAHTWTYYYRNSRFLKYWAVYQRNSSVSPIRIQNKSRMQNTRSHYDVTRHVWRHGSRNPASSNLEIQSCLLT